MSRGQRFGKYSGAGKSRSHQSQRFNRRSGAGRPRNGRGLFSDITKFINKAEPIADIKPYKAANSFADFSIDERLKRNVSRAGYSNPTPIQDQTIPHALKGRDIVGIANTGTGKTAAFILPLLGKVIQDKKQNVLIVAPTRELAIQINQEFTKFASGLRIFSVCTVGGMPIFRQIKDLRRSHNFIIGDRKSVV